MAASNPGQYEEAVLGGVPGGCHPGCAAEEKTLAQIASEPGIHPAMTVRWRQPATDELPGLFQREERGGEGEGAPEVE